MRLHSVTLNERNAATHRVMGFASFVRRGIGRIGQRLRCRAVEWELGQLDDRMLLDIGLTRAEVHAAAYGLLRLGGASGEEPAREPKQPCKQVGSTAGGAPATTTQRRSCPGYRLAAAGAAALVAPAVSATSPAAGDAFAHLPTVADLPAGTIKVSPPVPGTGEHWANPKDLPLGPIYCVMRQRVVCAEFMVSQRDLANGESFERLRFGLDGKQPPIDHLELNFQPRGHEGFEVPHYDLHMYFVSPEARFSQESAAR